MSLWLDLTLLVWLMGQSVCPIQGCWRGPASCLLRQPWIAGALYSSGNPASPCLLVARAAIVPFLAESSSMRAWPTGLLLPGYSAKAERTVQSRLLRPNGWGFVGAEQWVGPGGAGRSRPRSCDRGQADTLCPITRLFGATLVSLPYDVRGITCYSHHNRLGITCAVLQDVVSPMCIKNCPKRQCAGKCVAIREMTQSNSTDSWQDDKQSLHRSQSRDVNGEAFRINSNMYVCRIRTPLCVLEIYRESKLERIGLHL